MILFEILAYIIAGLIVALVVLYVLMLLMAFLGHSPFLGKECDEEGCYTLPNGECVSDHPCIHSVPPETEDD